MMSVALRYSLESLARVSRARLCTAEENFFLGQMRDARAFAMRARETLAKDSSEYRRATDIILASQPSPEEMKAIARQGG